MSKFCGECTYLDLSTGDIYGKFYCEKKWERHKATDVECGSFCTAYNRDYSTMQNAYRYSEDHSSSGCYLTTMLSNIFGLPDNNVYLETMRNFRKNILQKDEQYKSLLVEYDIIGPKIAECLSNDPLRKQIAEKYFNAYIIAIVDCINNNNIKSAIFTYKNMTNLLKHFYKLGGTEITTLEIDSCDIKEAGHGKYKVKKIIPNQE